MTITSWFMQSRCLWETFLLWRSIVCWQMWKTRVKQTPTVLNTSVQATKGSCWIYWQSSTPTAAFVAQFWTISTQVLQWSVHSVCLSVNGPVCLHLLVWTSTCVEHCQTLLNSDQSQLLFPAVCILETAQHSRKNQSFHRYLPVPHKHLQHATSKTHKTKPRKEDTTVCNLSFVRWTQVCAVRVVSSGTMVYHWGEVSVVYPAVIAE